MNATVLMIHLVFQHAKAAESEDWARFEALDHAQHRWGAVVLVGILLALGLGVNLLVQLSSV